MRTLDLGEAVGPGVPTGGTANQVLVKNGATNFDTSWKDASQLPAIGDEATAREAADAALADGLAIIANGDTHAAVAAGQAVFVRSHSTLAAGLYWASSAIGTNAALSTSNLTADNQGGLNKLKGDIDSLNSNSSHIIIKPYTVTLSENSYVTPFTHFGLLQTPYTQKIGTVIGVTSRNTSAVANFDRSQNRITVVGTNITSVTVDVIFATNVEIRAID